MVFYFLQKIKNCKMPLKTQTLRTKNHHEKMFQFVLLMGKSMFWKKEIYENTPENSTEYSYIFVFSIFWTKNMTFVSILKKTPCYTTFYYGSKNNFFEKTHFLLKQFRAENSFRKFNLKLSLCSNNWTLNTDFIIKSSRIHRNPPTRSLALAEG